MQNERAMWHHIHQACIACILFFLFSISNVSAVVNTIDERYHLPHVLQKPLAEHQTGAQLAGHVDRVNTGTVWQIFTAREGVQGHANANLTGTSVTFDFLEGFVVVREEANVIQAVHHEYVDRVNLLDGHEENTWWFDKEDMLLWSNSMVQDEVVIGEYITEVNRRAMVINRFDMSSEEMADRGFFDQPTLDARRLDEARSFTRLFVYREHGDYLLLGEQQRVSAGNIRHRMRGWVHRDFLSDWNHHLALEINWENADDRPPAAIFSHLEDAREYSRNARHDPVPPRRKLYVESPPYAERAKGIQPRFLLLTKGVDMDNMTPKIGYVGPTTYIGLDAMDCIDAQEEPERIEKVDRKLRENVKISQQVNVLFLVDATSGMEPYAQTIIEQLENTMQGMMAGIDTIDEGDNYNLGAFVFRDEAEPRAYAASNDAEWTDEVDVITGFLERELRSEHNTDANKSHKGALYHAMHHSAALFGPNPVANNYMILIGAAGDNPESYPHIQQEDVVDILDAHQFNLLAYQVHHRVDADGRHEGAYDTYRSEVKEIIEALALRRNQHLHDSHAEFMARCQDPAAAAALEFIFDPFPLTFDDSAYDFEYDDLFGVYKKLISLNLYPIIAQFTWPDDDSTISLDDFGQDLLYDLVGYPGHISYVHPKQPANLYGDREISCARLILQGLRLGLRLEEVLMLFFGFDEVYQEGYTAYLPQWLDGEPLYHYVAFLGHNQSQNIARDINNLIEPGVRIQTEVLRERIYHIWQRLLVRDLGLITEIDFHNQTIAQNYTFLSGLPAPEVYKEYTNADILTPSVFSDTLLMNLCMDLIITGGHLLSIVDGENVFDRSFFRSYRGYIDQYFNVNNVNNTTMEVIDDLVDYFARYEYDDYPKKVTHPARPNQSQFWYYWIDTRLLPSEISNPADIIKSIARGS